jgi:cadmium resistance transport/sequestration family protein
VGWITQAIATGITAFVATNIDDILILMVFFSQSNFTFRPWHIVLGQYLGFGIILLASLPGFFGGLILQKEWIGLLGFVPIGIGLYRLWRPEQEEKVVQTISQEGRDQFSRFPGFAKLSQLIPPQTYQVAMITLANGGDNIGIYIPLFANSSLASLSVILIVFLFLVGLWCYIAFQLVQHPAIAHILTHYGEAIVPFVLIGLGIFILKDSESYRLLPPFRN